MVCAMCLCLLLCCFYVIRSCFIGAACCWWCHCYLSFVPSWYGHTSYDGWLMMIMITLPLLLLWLWMWMLLLLVMFIPLHSRRYCDYCWRCYCWLTDCCLLLRLTTLWWIDSWSNWLIDWLMIALLGDGHVSSLMNPSLTLVVSLLWHTLITGVPDWLLTLLYRSSSFNLGDCSPSHSLKYQW